MSNNLLHKVLKLVPLTATGTDVFVATMTTFLCDYYDDLEETITYMKSIKINSYLGENVTDFRAAILVDSEHLESAGYFKTDYLRYITRIFEDAYYSRFRLREIQKYKEVTELINKISVCDMDVISTEELITYESLVQ